jgi:hypothetical protein
LTPPCSILLKPRQLPAAPDPAAARASFVWAPLQWLNRQFCTSCSTIIMYVLQRWHLTNFAHAAYHFKKRVRMWVPYKETDAVVDRSLTHQDSNGLRRYKRKSEIWCSFCIIHQKFRSMFGILKVKRSCGWVGNFIWKKIHVSSGLHLASCKLTCLSVRVRVFTAGDNFKITFLFPSLLFRNKNFASETR